MLCCPVMMSILLLHLVFVRFFFPGLVSGMRRRRRRKKNSQSRSPIQRRRERTMPSVRARTGTEGWTHLSSYQKPGAPSSRTTCRHHLFMISCPHQLTRASLMFLSTNCRMTTFVGNTRTHFNLRLRRKSVGSHGFLNTLLSITRAFAQPDQ